MRSVKVAVWCLVLSFCYTFSHALEPSNLEGIWQGTFPASPVDVNLYWRITCIEDNSVVVWYDSPFYGIKDVPVPVVEVTEDSLVMSVGLFPSEFRGGFGFEDNVIRGSYKGEGPSVPFAIVRISANPETLLPYMRPRLSESGEAELKYNYLIPEQVEGGWPVASAEEVGLDSDLLEQFTQQALAEKYPNLHSLLIVKDGKLVYEEYFYGHDRNIPHHIYSNGKGITSLAIGMAIEQGYIESVDAPIVSFFSDYEALFDVPGKRQQTLYHYLSMTSGLEWDETSTSYYDPRNTNRQMQSSPDYYEFIFSRPLVDRPGTKFTYNSGLPNVLNAVLWIKTETPPWEYIEANIFRPLGFEYYAWDTTPGGNLGGIFLRPRDFLKLGQLYMDRGNWDGEQIISPKWFDNCYKPGRLCEGPEYWNHWGREVMFVDGVPVVEYSGGGFGGQGIHAVPEYNLVVAMNAGNYFTPSVDQDQILTTYILPPLVEASKPSPDYEYTGDSTFTGITGLQYHDTMIAGLGALWGAMEYLGKDVSEAWVYGITGTAFILNANPSIYPNCLGRWANTRYGEMLEKAGIDGNMYAAYYRQLDFEETRKTAWDSVRAALDRGCPVTGFHMNIPEMYVIYGYDRYGYYFKGSECPTGYGPRCWNTIADNEPGWFEMQTLWACEEVSSQELVLAALSYAVELNSSPENHQHRGYTFGPGAYDVWQERSRARTPTGSGWRIPLQGGPHVGRKRRISFWKHVRFCQQIIVMGWSKPKPVIGQSRIAGSKSANYSPLRVRNAGRKSRTGKMKRTGSTHRNYCNKLHKRKRRGW